MNTQCDRLLEILEDNQWHSTKELIERTRITFPPRRIYDLKRRGFKIVSESVKVGEAWWAAYRLLPQHIQQSLL